MLTNNDRIFYFPTHHDKVSDKRTPDKMIVIGIIWHYKPECYYNCCFSCEINVLCSKEPGQVIKCLSCSLCYGPNPFGMSQSNVQNLDMEHYCKWANNVTNHTHRQTHVANKRNNGNTKTNTTHTNRAAKFPAWTLPLWSEWEGHFFGLSSPIVFLAFLFVSLHWKAVCLIVSVCFTEELN